MQFKVSAYFYRMKTSMLLFVPIILTIIFSNPGVPIENNLPIALGKGQMPSVTKDHQGNIHLIYGIGDSLLYRYSSDKGQTFSQPELIAIIEGLFAFATRGPQIVATRDGLSVVAPTEAGNIWSFVKTGADKWVKTARVTDIDSVNLEGFVSLASDGSSRLFATWLDLRNNRRNKLYGARSEDCGRSWSSNIKVYVSPDTTICECCKTSVAMNGNNVYVMFRNWLDGNRDLHIISSSDAGRSFGKANKLGNGSWALNGCPMDGGNIVIGKNGILETVWRREAKIYSCQPGKPEVEIGEGKGATLESINGQNAYAWTTNGEVICVLPDGTRKNLGKGMSPVLKAINNKSLLCVWENDEQIFSSLISL